MAESTVTSKGQITIPKVVRERLHLEPGDKVYFDMREDGTVSLLTRRHPIEGLFGLLKDRVQLARPIPVEEMNPATLDDRRR